MRGFVVFLAFLYWQTSGDDALAKFGSGGTTNVTPVSVVILLLAAVLIIFLPRKYVLFPFLFTALVIPLATAVVVGGVHLHLLRFLLIPALLKAFIQSSKERPLLERLHPVDKAFIAFQVISMIAFLALNPEMGALINQIGS